LSDLLTTSNIGSSASAGKREAAMDKFKHSNMTERFNYMASFRFFIETLRRNADVVRPELS
jgi:hypothetical protein